MSSDASEWGPAEAAALLTVPNSSSNKYSRGVLGLRTGSAAYPGAAVLGAQAAWRTGVGSVRFFSAAGDREPAFGLPTPAAAVLAVRPETVFASDSAEDFSKVDAWVIGSGTDAAHQSFTEHQAMLRILTGTAPVVVDAGALQLLAQVDSRQLAPCVLTPHLGEFVKLCVDLGLTIGDLEHDDARVDAALMLAARLGAVVHLKGWVTVVASPTGLALKVGPATPWLATAGTGDVLAAVIGALVACSDANVTHDHLARIAASAAVLHDQAARIASADHDAVGAGHPITASDVSEQLSKAFAAISGR